MFAVRCWDDPGGLASRLLFIAGVILRGLASCLLFIAGVTLNQDFNSTHNAPLPQQHFFYYFIVLCGKLGLPYPGELFPSVCAVYFRVSE